MGQGFTFLSFFVCYWFSFFVNQTPEYIVIFAIGRRGIQK